LKKFQKLIEINPQIKLEILAENLKISESQLYDLLLIWKEKLPMTIKDQHIYIEDLSKFKQDLENLISEKSLS